MTTKTTDTAVDVLPPEIEKAIDEAVSAALDKMNIRQLIEGALRELDICKIVDEVFQEFVFKIG